MEGENLGPILEKELRIVQMLVDTAVDARVLNIITLEIKITDAGPTQEAVAILVAAKALLGHLASKVYISCTAMCADKNYPNVFKFKCF